MDIASLPKYRSHKIVRAAKILGIKLQMQDGSALLKIEPFGGPLPEETLAAPTGWLISYHGSESDFGYFVAYDDGYASWSPTKAFEEGYNMFAEGKNVFAGKPDARQSDKTDAPVSRFRPTYRALSDDEKALHDELKTKAVELEELFAKVPAGRYSSLAMTSLEQAIMWIVKQLTS
jgi:hypothetical protein